MAGELAIDYECNGVRLKMETKAKFMKAFAKEGESFSVALGRYLTDMVSDVRLSLSEQETIDGKIQKNYEKRLAKRTKKSRLKSPGGGLRG